MRMGRSAKRRRFTFWQLQPPCVVDSAVDLDFSRRQSRVLVDCGSRPVRCAGVDHAGLMFGCGDTVRKLVKDMRLRATESLKNAKKVGATMRLSRAPVSRIRYPCVSTWLEGLLCIWLRFASCKRQEQAREGKRHSPSAR